MNALTKFYNASQKIKNFINKANRGLSSTHTFRYMYKRGHYFVITAKLSCHSPMDIYLGFIRRFIIASVGSQGQVFMDLIFQSFLFIFYGFHKNFCNLFPLYTVKLYKSDNLSDGQLSSVNQWSYGLVWEDTEWFISL